MTDDALAWYERAQSELVSWAAFEAHFKSRFVDLAAKRHEALRKLETLTRDKDQRLTPHLEYTMKLCYDFDPEMSEERVIERSLQTLRSEEAYALLSVRPTTISELRAHLTWMDKTIPHLNDRKSQPSDLAINRIGGSSRNDDEVRFGRSRSSSREKSERGKSRSSSLDRHPQLQHRSRSPAPANYAQRGRSPAPAAAQRAPLQQRIPTQYFTARQYPATDYNPNGRVLCNWCNNVGHTIKHCRRRMELKPRTRARLQQSGNSYGR
ncbi:uncharacterized protein LOC108864149 [Galendromus occidentalis]|uniref:Uncharacterized protein LOC108864149 n=1 Tax=Galendromus occidentalis TaxID=34638 RepID=A0AAJ7L5F4_9ACAR|nr:uncharacterized protein LOC108864149 [Galendromus occidentalis]